MNRIVLGILLCSLVLISKVYAGGAVTGRQKAQKAAAQRQAVVQQAVVQKTLIERQKQMAVEQGVEQVIEVPKPVDEFEVAEVVDFDQVWKSLESSSQAWPLIIDQEVKVMIVQKFIDQFHRKGAVIQKPPQYYVNLIDGMSQQNPSMLSQPFEQVFQVVAVIEYDFDTGKDKDVLARKVFPDEKSFEANKKRLGLR